MPYGTYPFRYGVTVSIRLFHSLEPGSIPGIGTLFLMLNREMAGEPNNIRTKNLEKAYKKYGFPDLPSNDLSAPLVPFELVPAYNKLHKMWLQRNSRNPTRRVQKHITNYFKKKGQKVPMKSLKNIAIESGLRRYLDFLNKELDRYRKKNVVAPARRYNNSEESISPSRSPVPPYSASPLPPPVPSPSPVPFYAGIPGVVYDPITNEFYEDNNNNNRPRIVWQDEDEPLPRGGGTRKKRYRR